MKLINNIMTFVTIYKNRSLSGARMTRRLSPAKNLNYKSFLIVKTAN